MAGKGADSRHTLGDCSFARMVCVAGLSLSAALAASSVVDISHAWAEECPVSEAVAELQQPQVDPVDSSGALSQEKHSSSDATSPEEPMDEGSDSPACEDAADVPLDVRSQLDAGFVCEGVDAADVSGDVAALEGVDGAPGGGAQGEEFAPEVPDMPSNLSDCESLSDKDVLQSEGEGMETLEPSSGPIVSGWVTEGGQRYYLDDEGNALTGEHEIDGDWYYFDPGEAGALRTGFVWLPDSAYVGCFDLTTGKKLFGEQQVHGAAHYFDESDGAICTGLVELPKTELHDEEIAYFDQFDGSMQTGAVNVSGTTYYFDEDTGAMVHDAWRPLGYGAYAYFDSDGSICRGEKWMEGERYWFDAVTGESPFAQFLRWELSHAVQSEKATGFNGAQLTEAQLRLVNEALAAFTHEGYSTGFVLMDLKTGKGVSYNLDSVFYSASTLKAPYIASIYSGAFHNSIEESAPWYSTCEDICVWSDGYQYAYLRQVFGDQVFAEWLSAMGVDASKAIGNYTWCTARDLGKMWLGMYDYFLYSGPAGGQLSSMLSHGFGSSIYSELGGEYSVSSKGGWYPELPGYTATNDGGIVRASSGDYMVAILSNAPERFDLTRTLVRALDTVHKMWA